jgi:hypothetical protein
MRTENTGSTRLFSRAGIFVLLLFIVTSQATDIKAQKLPPLLGTRAEDPSAFNIQSLQKLKAEYDRKVNGTDAEKQEARQLRNRLIGVGIDQVDALYFDKLKGDRKKIRLVQFILDFLEIGATTAISLTNGERAKTIISEGLGALQASRTSLNKNFQLLERQVLINRMAADRANVLVAIFSKLDRDVIQYPWELASAELRAYRDAGTLDNALASLSAGVGKERADAEERVREVKDEPLTGAAKGEDLKLAESASNLRSSFKTSLGIDSKKEEALQKLRMIVEDLGEDEEIGGMLRARDISPTTDDGMKILNALADIRRELLRNNRRDLVRKINRVTIEVNAQ